MKKVGLLALTCVITFGSMLIPVYATSLDEVANQTVQSTETSSTTTNENTASQENTPSQDNQQTNRQQADSFMQSMNDATDLTDMQPGASKVNQGIKKVVSFIVQVMSYGITALLVVRVLLDLCYIGLPFTRAALSNGYAGTPQGDMGMQQGGMGGMNGMGGMSGMGGMGMSGMGGMGGYGMGRYGMGGMSGMGMGGMNGMGMGGMNGMQQGAQGANPAMGRVQLVSNAALNAVASESVIGPNGKAKNAVTIYMKDMIPTLVAIPILIVLGATGALTQLGLLLGQLLANAASSIGGMI